MTADVKVGQVRRAKPRSMMGGPLTYLAAPFRVVEMLPNGAIIEGLDGARRRTKLLAHIRRCPLWPSEHEQWKDARGYEVKT